MQQPERQTLQLTRQDFTSDQEVRWCPGCGDYAILATMQKTLPKLGIPKQNVVFVSGIGCSSRFPYYLDTFGFHTIHGRAPAIATGIKCANPDLTVFVVTGDGDGLSIGSNHLLHLMRRNLNVTVLLFNNRIYGLTKGQYSPTSELGKKTKSSPLGSLEDNIDPIQFALAANCSFVARGIDVDAKGLGDIFERAVAHPGTAFIEILQNCNVFNDGAFDSFTDKAHRAANTLFLTPGQPMVFGADADKGVHLQNGEYTVCSEKDAIKHDPTLPVDRLMALSKYQWPDFPLVTGVLRQVERPCFDKEMQARKQSKDLAALLPKESWQVP